MAKECFCGCGREVPFGRKRAANLVGRQFAETIAVLQGALNQHADPDNEALLGELVAEGTRHRDAIRDVIHGDLDRSQLDKPAQRAWWERAVNERKRLIDGTLAADYAGWNAVGQTRLIYAGARAPAVIVAVTDTGSTLGEDPRVEIRLRVEPQNGGAPFEVERKVLVSRVNVPRAGERVEVAYDPADPDDFTFRIADLTDDAIAAESAQSAAGLASAPAAAGLADPLDRLRKLGELRDSGVITTDEFEAKKRELLEDVY